MKINIDNSNFSHSKYLYLSDDSREVLDDLDSTIFVKTDLNARFLQEMQANNATIISPNELKKYLVNNTKIIGITGTNGKTTIASCIYSLLLSLGFRCALLGTRGFFINDERIASKGLTTPTLLELYNNIHIASKYNCDYFVMEVSSHAIAQNRIEGLDFALKILSNITADHLDFHKTIEEYERVKNSFFSDEGLKLINKDSLNARFNIINCYTYGIENKGNLSLNAYSIKDSIDGHITWNDFKRKQKEECLIHSNLIGKYNLYNILASIAAVKILNNDIALDDISKALNEFGGVCGRMEVVHINPLVIVDFAHTPDGMKNILSSFIGRKIKLVFGAGGDRDRLKRPVMGQIAEIYSTRIYLTSDNPRSENPHSIINEILEGISNKNKVFVESNRKLAIQKALSELRSDEVLLILGKGDETYQIIGDKILPFDDRVEVREFYKNDEARE
ncbi:UDP-N-acetylmuramoyl-L-alanyl-D-glutamate--2,6-diaminopimelate ligase [Helicobacter sp. 16-1353]|uniref:UDP-N-acetylmuramoyl-L-alanyl-D-glutamate--2, 6-diaminopimelate ligase n=1 Tax=Helicobacter sp. 16-1353 TaxID=2004996 RepID=UPI000DCE3F6E|nr:UDP-N-acetylmuramoyl-L-alanyl-D-glutamate--2,6-diaminopimelate ligase [Helicobacter sp. 16-1353]RAX54904.1 UDP-N-acetylmuramoyl-L-alanyl-D-glutamate--2,6-diaminopimelate ligase [Helicobacter sp. 16-1353]